MKYYFVRIVIRNNGFKYIDLSLLFVIYLIVIWLGLIWWIGKWGIKIGIVNEGIGY